MSIIDSLKNKISQYTDVYIKLFQLNLISKTSSLLSYFMFAIINIFLVFTIVTLMGFGLTAAWVAMGVPVVAAFFITVGIYLFLLFILVGLRKSVTRFFAGAFIRVLTEGDNDEEKS